MKKQVTRLVKELIKKKLTIALAESMTCGLVSHTIAGCIGASEVLMGSVVCYTPEVKHVLLKVPDTKIKKCTCESKEITELLAKNLSRVIKADIHAAITGLAAEGGSETKDKPVGTVFISIYYKKKIYNHRLLFRGSPLQIRKKACSALYTMVLENI